MRSLNLRFGLILVVCLGTLAVTVHAFHGFQVDRQTDILHKRAEELIAEDSILDALGYLRRYVRMVPDDVDALEKMGTLLADTNQYGAAYGYLENLLRREPNRHRARRRLVEVSIGLGRYSDATYHIEKYLLDESPNDGELLVMYAQCRIANGTYEGAEKTLNKIIAIGDVSEQIPAYIQLINLYRNNLNRNTSAVSAMTQMMELSPNTPESCVQRGEFLRNHATERFTQEALGIDEDENISQPIREVYQFVKQDADRALELDENSPEALLLAGRCANRLDQPEEARKLFERGLKNHPGFSPLHVALSEFDLKDNRPEEAIARLERGLEESPQSQDLLWNLANILIQQNMIDRAQGLVDSLEKTNAPGTLTAYLKARILVEQGEWRSATLRLEGIRADLNDFPDLAKQADFQLGICYQQLGNFDQQYFAYSRAVKVDPFWIPARQGKAQALLSVGRTEEALSEYVDISKLENAPKMIWSQVIQLKILANLIRGKTDAGWEEIENDLKKVEAVVPDSPRIPIYRAEILVAQDKIEEARQVLLDAREKSNDQIELWSAVINLHLREREWDEAQIALQNAEQILPDSALLRLLQARYEVYRNGKNAKERIRELSEPPQNFTEDDNKRLWGYLIPYSLAVEDLEHTEALCKNIANMDANNLRIRLLLFDLAFRARRIEAMEEVLKEVFEIEGNGPLWRYGEAIRHGMLGANGNPEHFDIALQHLAEARVLRPAWARIPLLTAQIKELQNNTDDAIKDYLEAVDLGERRSEYISHIVSLLYKHRRYRDADNLIRRLQEQQIPFSNEMLRIAAEVSFNLADIDRALDLAQRAAGESEREEDLIWLGTVLGIQGREKEAEEKLRKAVTVSPKSTTPWVVLITHLCRSEKFDQARKTILEAEEKLPPETAPLALAQSYEILAGASTEYKNEIEKAEQYYEKALKSSGEDAEVVRQATDFYLRNGILPKAERWLSSIAARKVRSNEEDVLWSKRNLALMLMNRGGHQNYLNAKAIIDENLANPEHSSKDEHAKAVILAMYPTRQSRKEAISLLEDYMKEQRTPSDKDLLILYQLYLRDDNWARASSTMRSLLANYGDTPRYVSEYVRALLNRGEIDQARIWLNRLVRIDPEGTNTAILRASILFRENKHTEALSNLEQFLQKQTERKENHILVVARQFENFARNLTLNDELQPAERYLKKAEKLFSEFIALKPESELALAGFYARQSRFDEALEMVEDKLTAAKPKEIATVFSLILSNGRASTSQIKRVESMLIRALAKTKEEDSFALRLVLADVYNWLGRYEKAEQAYRELLRTRGDHSVVLNNLAVLIALHGKNKNESLQMINKALEISGPMAELLDSRAIVYLALNEPQKAFQDITEALSDSSTATREFHHACITKHLGRSDLATASLAKAREMGLNARTIHPVERESFEKLQLALQK